MTAVLAIESLKPFVYEIVNVRSKNHAFLSDDGAVVGHTTMNPDDVLTRPVSGEFIPRGLVIIHLPAAMDGEAIRQRKILYTK
jgi:hypothetical protein